MKDCPARPAPPAVLRVPGPLPQGSGSSACSPLLPAPQVLQDCQRYRSNIREVGDLWVGAGWARGPSRAAPSESRRPSGALALGGLSDSSTPSSHGSSLGRRCGGERASRVEVQPRCRKPGAGSSRRVPWGPPAPEVTSREVPAGGGMWRELCEGRQLPAPPHRPLWILGAGNPRPQQAPQKVPPRGGGSREDEDMRVSECASLAAARISIKCPNPDLAPRPGRKNALVTRVSWARMTRRRFKKTGERAADERAWRGPWGGVTPRCCRLSSGAWGVGGGALSSLVSSVSPPRLPGPRCSTRVPWVLGTFGAATLTPAAPSAGAPARPVRAAGERLHQAPADQGLLPPQGSLLRGASWGWGTPGSSLHSHGGGWALSCPDLDPR